jgi:hypothetical protein
MIRDRRPDNLAACTSSAQALADAFDMPVVPTARGRDLPMQPRSPALMLCDAPAV